MFSHISEFFNNSLSLMTNNNVSFLHPINNVSTVNNQSTLENATNNVYNALGNILLKYSNNLSDNSSIEQLINNIPKTWEEYEIKQRVLLRSLQRKNDFLLHKSNENLSMNPTSHMINDGFANIYTDNCAYNYNFRKNVEEIRYLENQLSDYKENHILTVLVFEEKHCITREEFIKSEEVKINLKNELDYVIGLAENKTEIVCKGLDEYYELIRKIESISEKSINFCLNLIDDISWRPVSNCVSLRRYNTATIALDLWQKLIKVLIKDDSSNIQFNIENSIYLNDDNKPNENVNLENSE